MMDVRTAESVGFAKFWREHASSPSSSKAILLQRTSYFEAQSRRFAGGASLGPRRPHVPQRVWTERRLHCSRRGWLLCRMLSSKRRALKSKASTSNGSLATHLTTLAAGGMAGAVSRTATAPVDRLKVMMQAGDKAATSVVAGFRNIRAESGWMGFYRGNGTNVLKIVPESASKFFSYSWFSRVVASDANNMQVHERFFAGGLAGLTSQVLVYPLEVAKTRLAIASSGTYRGFTDCCMQTLRSGGVKALYRGLGTSCAGIVPYSGIDLACFMTLKEQWMRRHEGSPPDALTLLAIGATSFGLGQVATYPLQLIRTKLQGLSNHSGNNYSGPMQCLRCTVHRDGVRGLYRGIGPNFMKALPAISISYLVYEKMSSCLNASFNSS